MSETPCKAELQAHYSGSSRLDHWTWRSSWLTRRSSVRIDGRTGIVEKWKGDGVAVDVEAQRFLGSYASWLPLSQPVARLGCFHRHSLPCTGRLHRHPLPCTGRLHRRPLSYTLRSCTLVRPGYTCSNYLHNPTLSSSWNSAKEIIPDHATFIACSIVT